MAAAFEDRSGIEVEDIEIPVATGFSNETVMFNASWTEQGRRRGARYVARIEPDDGGMFPIQTPHCAVSVELQYRVMAAVDAAGLDSSPGAAAAGLRRRPRLFWAGPSS